MMHPAEVLWDGVPPTHGPKGSGERETEKEKDTPRIERTWTWHASCRKGWPSTVHTGDYRILRAKLFGTGTLRHRANGRKGAITGTRRQSDVTTTSSLPGG